MWVFLSMYFLITLATCWKILAGSSEKYSAEAPVEDSVVFHVIAVCGLNFLCLWQKDKKGKRSRLVAWRGQPARSIMRGDETGLCPMRNSRLSVHTALNCFIFRSSYGLDLKNKDFKNEKHTTLITKASNRLKGGNSTWLQLDQQKHDRGHKQPWELCWEVGPDQPNGFPRGGTAAWEEAHGDLRGFFLSMVEGSSPPRRLHEKHRVRSHWPLQLCVRAFIMFLSCFLLTLVGSCYWRFETWYPTSC